MYDAQHLEETFIFQRRSFRRPVQGDSARPSALQGESASAGARQAELRGPDRADGTSPRPVTGSRPPAPPVLPPTEPGAGSAGSWIRWHSAPTQVQPARPSIPFAVQRKLVSAGKEIQPGAREWRPFIEGLPYSLRRLQGLETLLQDLVDLEEEVPADNPAALEAAVLKRLEERQRDPDAVRRRNLARLEALHEEDKASLILDPGRYDSDLQRQESKRLRDRKAREATMNRLREELRPRDERLRDLAVTQEEIAKLTRALDGADEEERGRLRKQIEALKQKQFEIEIEANVDGREQYVADDSTTIRIDQGAFMSGDKYGVAVAVRNHPSAILNLLWDESFYVRKYLSQAVEEGFTDERGQVELLNYYNYLHPNRPIEDEREILASLRDRMRTTAQEVYKFYLKCGIPEHRIKLRKVTNAAIQMDAYSVGKTTELTKELLAHQGEKGRAAARATLLGGLTEDEKRNVDRIVDNDPDIQKAPLIVLVWLRKSGAMPGGAYPHLDTYKPVIRQLVRLAAEAYPQATFWMIGDRIYESIDESWKQETGASANNLMEYWKSWRGNPHIPTNWNLHQQFYFLDKIRHKTISIGMRSGMLEAPAMLGMRTIWIDHYLSTGKDRMEKYSKGPLKENYKLFELERTGKEMQVLHDLLVDLDRIQEWLREGSSYGFRYRDEQQEELAPGNALPIIAECIQNTLESIDLSAESTASASRQTEEFLATAGAHSEDPASLLRDLKAGKKPPQKLPADFGGRVQGIKDEQGNARKRAERAERLRRRVKEIAHVYLQQGISLEEPGDQEASGRIIEMIDVFREQIAFRFSRREEERFQGLFSGFAADIHREHQIPDRTFDRVTRSLQRIAQYLEHLPECADTATKRKNFSDPEAIFTLSAAGQEKLGAYVEQITALRGLKDIRDSKSTREYRLKGLREILFSVMADLESWRAALGKITVLPYYDQRRNRNRDAPQYSERQEMFRKKFLGASGRMGRFSAQLQSLLQKGDLRSAPAETGSTEPKPSSGSRASASGSGSKAEEPRRTLTLPVDRERTQSFDVLSVPGDGLCLYNSIYQAATRHPLLAVRQHAEARFAQAQVLDAPGLKQRVSAILQLTYRDHTEAILAQLTNLMASGWEWTDPGLPLRLLGMAREAGVADVGALFHLFERSDREARLTFLEGAMEAGERNAEIAALGGADARNALGARRVNLVALRERVCLAYATSVGHRSQWGGPLERMICANLLGIPIDIHEGIMQPDRAGPILDPQSALRPLHILYNHVTRHYSGLNPEG